MAFEMSRPESAAPHTPDQDSNDKPMSIGAIVLASIIGSTCLVIADILKNDITATTILAKYAQVRLPSQSIAHLELFAIILMVLVGLGLCYVFRPKTLPGAFARSTGLHSVLFGINTITGLVGVAEAQTAFAPSSVASTITYALERPETYGPLGLGTKITGRSSARVNELKIGQPIKLPDCLEITEVGHGVFCAIPRRDAELILDVSLPGGREPVWVLVNAPGWTGAE